MKIGDRVFVRGYIDEIRKDTVIIRNAGGYFGTIPSEVITGELPSAQPNVSDRNVGEWGMFELITSAWYGKQCYFTEKNGIVYSGVSCKYMSVDEAIKEFLMRIGDNG